MSRPGRRHEPWTGLTALLALALIALLFVSGAVMSLYYSPAPGTAWDSVDYAQYKLPFGDVVRGVHVYAANLLLVVLLAHVAGLFWTGAYKSPGQWSWMSLLLVALVVPAFMVTGDLLPWNQRGYWSTQVRMRIVATVPLAGDFLASVLRGGPHLGVVTLTRFYVLHILFLPCALIALLAAHGYFVRREAATDWLAGERGRDPLLLLDLVNRWLLVSLVVAVALGLAAWRFPAWLGDPADPTDATYVPKPEWWALVLNQFVTIFAGRWAFVGSTLIPGLLVGLLVALPFLDRSPERHPSRRKPVMLVAASLTVVLLGLAAVGYATHYMPAPAGPHAGRAN